MTERDTQDREKHKMWRNWCNIKNKMVGKGFGNIKEGVFATRGGIATPFPSIICVSVPSSEQER